MQLRKFSYQELVATPQEWVLETLTLGRKNLLVGKNASGKSRTLSVINALASMLAGLRPPNSQGTYESIFEDGKDQYAYKVDIGPEGVRSEVLTINGTTKLDRQKGGYGTIWAHEIDNGSSIKFQSPITELAAATRRDALQHPFLEPLNQWAANVRHYQFGTNIGKDAFAVFVPEGQNVNDRDQQAVVGVFRDACKKFPDTFVESLKADMGAVGYDINHIELGSQVVALLPPGVVGLLLREKDLPGVTDQLAMSQGMYRVLSLLIYVNYFKAKGSASCLLVDDIGEGLDFDRSCRLIDLLRKKTDEFDIQLVLSTNDRFVMNQVPLEEWTFLQRRSNHVAVRNHENSRKIFEEFKFTGLSNFSFLELDVLNQPESGKST